MQDEARAERAHEAMGSLLRAASGLPKDDPERQWYVGAYRSIEKRYGGHPERSRRMSLLKPALALLVAGLIGYGVGQAENDYVIGSNLGQLGQASKTAGTERNQILETVKRMESQQLQLFRLLQQRQRGESPRPGSRARE